MAGSKIGPMQKALSANLIRLRDDFMKARLKHGTPIGVSVLSRLVTNNGIFLGSLKGARTTFTVRRYDDIVALFSKHWPNNAAWPEGIERPKH